MQIERVLYNEQRQRDFTPRDDALSFDKPTGACMMATAMLHALGAAANDTLESSNLQSFAAEVRQVAVFPPVSSTLCGLLPYWLLSNV